MIRPGELYWADFAEVGPHPVIVVSRESLNRVRYVLPLGPAGANREVEVTVRPARPAMTAEEWRARVRSMAGSVTDPTFERLPQPPLETREPLS